MKKNVVTLLTACLLGSSAFAQTTDNPWTVGFGYGAVDYAGSNGYKGLSTGNFNRTVYLYTSRYFTAGLSAYGRTHLGTLNRPTTVWKRNAQFGNVNLGLEYSFANDMILPRDAPIEPYVFAGAGLLQENKIMVGAGEFGLGVNFWLNDALAINLQAAFNKSFSKATVQPSFDTYSAGLRFRLGAGKDTDGDGITDKDDACPDKAGKEMFKGCPDTDNDGIEDSKDNCPTEAGLITLNGCPDKDGDGIKDGDDSCPDVAGEANMKGCPDKDKDGVADKDDSCPDVAGVASLKGCPDSDGDGIADKDDKCPNQKGEASFQGCPDSDGDGIADKDDKCPNEKGVASRQGCPEPKIDEKKAKEVEKQLEMDAKLIQFETGSAIIKKESYDDLDKISALMKEYPSAKFAVEGHTDNVGVAANNKTLSQNRADAVKKYIAGKGVEDSRISTKGYGQEKPIATNGTPAGRQQNRRVEIHLVK